MAKRDKRIEAMRRNPRQVTADELDTVLTGLGFNCRSGRGDHRVYTHPNLSHPVVVDPHRPHLKRYVVLAALEAIDEVQDVEED